MTHIQQSGRRARLTPGDICVAFCSPQAVPSYCCFLRGSKAGTGAWKRWLAQRNYMASWLTGCRNYGMLCFFARTSRERTGRHYVGVRWIETLGECEDTCAIRQERTSDVCTSGLEVRMAGGAGVRRRVFCRTYSPSVSILLPPTPALLSQEDGLRSPSAH